MNHYRVWSVKPGPGWVEEAPSMEVMLARARQRLLTTKGITIVGEALVSSLPSGEPYEVELSGQRYNKSLKREVQYAFRVKRTNHDPVDLDSIIRTKE